jgi:hypothetical protein
MYVLHFMWHISHILDVTRFLHDHSHYAVAQKKYVFIYDRDGVELHCLKSHIEPTRLEFLPYHWLLASIVYFLPLLSSFHKSDIVSVGQCWLLEVPRHFYWSTGRRTPLQARRMRHYGTERTQCSHPPGSSERVRDAVDTELASPRRPTSRSPWPCGGP